MITASAESSSRRSCVSIRPTLSPTFTCTSESMPFAASSPPIHAEFESMIWPSSSSVPTARTSQRRASFGGCRSPDRIGRHRRRGRFELAGPQQVLGATHQRVPLASHRKLFHNQVASTAVSGISV